VSDAPADTHFDVIIIGGGPGGYGAALYGASAGLTVALVEKDKVGGTCLHRGCVPAKELLETAHVFRTVGKASQFGVEAGAPSLQFATTMARKPRWSTGCSRACRACSSTARSPSFAGTGTLRADRSVQVASADGETTVLPAMP
jgi:dihydrolipoamide dehydrogenase